MLVKIKAPNGPLSLDVSPMDTVAEVMERVEREDGAVSGESVSRGECVLVKDKAELLMHMTLEECGVARNDVLKVQQVVLKGLKARRRKNPPRLRHGSFAEYSSEELTPSHQRVATPPYVSVLSDRRSSKSLCAKLRTERLHLLDVATNNLQATQQQSLQPPLSPTISASPTLVTFPLKVKTTTGKMIKVNVSASDTMNAVMTKVRRKWSLTPGEHCIAKIDENGIVPLQETETASVSGLAQGSIVLLTGSTSQCPMYDAAASDSLIDICGRSPKVGDAATSPHHHLKVKLGSGRIVRIRSVSWGQSLVADIAKAVRQKAGAPADEDDRLVYNDSVLPSGKTLQQCGVPHGDVVTYQAQDGSRTPPLSLPKGSSPKSIATLHVLPAKEGFCLPPAPEQSSLVSGARIHTPPSPPRPLRHSLSLNQYTHQPSIQSPLCKFTLCSLSPLFGPGPAPLSFPAC